jgi:sulfotransferase famil protein
MCLDTCLVGRLRRFVYAYVPKAACTSLKLWMATVEGLVPPGSTPQGTGGVHSLLRPQAALDSLPRQEADAILRDPAWFKFTFVRHPLARLVSAYLDKVVPAKATAARLIRRYQMHDPSAAWWQRLLARLRIDARRSLTFRQLVKQIARERPEELDEHFRPQSLLLSGLPLNFVGRVERIDEDLAVVQRRLDTNVPLSHKKRQSYTVEAGDFVADWPAEAFRGDAPHPHWRRFYPPAVRAGAVDIYGEDFARFGYHQQDETVGSSSLRRAA